MVAEDYRSGRGSRADATPTHHAYLQPMTTDRHRVVIAGGGVAGLEAMLALTRIAGPQTDVTVVSPDPEFRLRALSVNEPFARSVSRGWPVGRLCEEHGAHFIERSVVAVDPQRRSVRLSDDRDVEYDALLVAVGARAEKPFDSGASVFRGPQDVELVHGLVQDVEEGYTSHVAFVVPDGATWPLPLYELALMLAERAHAMCMGGVRITLVTAEGSPLEVFGSEVSDAVRGRVHEAGIELRTACRVSGIGAGRLLGPSGEPLAEVQRVVVLPRLRGLAIEGLPHDAEGFVPIDSNGRVRGTSGIWAAGDGTTCPIKQGGLAAEQAEAAAADIARATGADVELRPFAPVLRAELVTGGRPLFLCHEVGAGTAGATAEHPLWWPHSKVAAPRLATWLDHAERPYDRRFDSGPARVLHAEGDPDGGIELLR